MKAFLLSLIFALRCFAPTPTFFAQNQAATSAAFDPTTYGTLIGWYSARRETGFSDGDAVGTVTDFSSAAKNLTQATSAKKPVFKTGIVNSQPVFRCDGVDDVVAAASALASAPATIVVVSKYSAATFASYAGLITGTDGLPGETDLWLIGNSGGTVFYNGAPTTSYWKDGTSFAESSMSAPMNAFAVSVIQSSGYAAAKVQLGQDRAITSRMWNGDIAEVLIYSDVLSTGNRQSVEVALKAIFGTP